MKFIAFAFLVALATFLFALFYTLHLEHMGSRKEVIEHFKRVTTWMARIAVALLIAFLVLSMLV